MPGRPGGGKMLVDHKVSNMNDDYGDDDLWTSSTTIGLIDIQHDTEYQIA